MIDKVGAMQSEQLMSYACWMCRGDAMPNNIQRFAVCPTHLVARLRKCMGLTPRGKAPKRKPDEWYAWQGASGVVSLVETHSGGASLAAGDAEEHATLVDQLHDEMFGEA